MTGIARPLPRPDRDSQPYWEGIAAGELRIQRCASCQTLRWPARAICHRCHSFDADWVALSGRGTIKSWVRTHQRFHPAFADALPYVTLLVAIEEQADIQIIGSFADAQAEAAIDMPVRAVFGPGGVGEALLFWAP